MRTGVDIIVACSRSSDFPIVFVAVVAAALNSSSTLTVYCKKI